MLEVLRASQMRTCAVGITVAFLTPSFQSRGRQFTVDENVKGKPSWVFIEIYHRVDIAIPIVLMF